MKAKIKFLCLYLFFSPVCLFAQTSGGFDLSFDTDGKNTYNFGGTEIPYATAIQSNGRIVSVGKSGINVALTRCNQNGSLDNSFSADGVATTAVNFVSISTAYGVAIQSDNKIVVVGTTRLQMNLDYQYFILRYNTDGTLDNTFSGDGKLVEDDTNDDVFYGVSIQPDGKILCIGKRTTTNGSQFVVRRYNANGTVDTGFYGSTFAATNYPLGYARAVVLQPDGKIVVVGDSYASPAASTEDFVTIRLNL